MIQVSGVEKTFRSGRGTIRALKEVSFFVEGGQSATLVGTSGSGKTTLLHCIGGLERIDRGRIDCFGVSVGELSSKALSRFQRTQVGFVFQAGNLLSYLTVHENIAFPLMLNRASKRETALRVHALLEKTGLSGFGPAFPHELSGGELQRAAVARAMSHAPRLLLADEPTASLDSETGKRVVQMILALSAEEQCTVIIATHDTALIALSENTIHLRDGELLKEEP